MSQTSPLHSVKRLLERSFPRPYDALRWRWYSHVLHKALNVIVMDHGLVVQSGPFQGMKYIPEMMSSLSPKQLIQHALLAKLLGSYEAELHPVCSQLLGKDYDNIVNIGCSDGYYSVGFALCFPRARVFAFDVDPAACQFCEQMARLNGVADRVNVGGECTIDHLKLLATGRTLILCDCEGCELALLRLDLVPGLAACDLIVELHDCYEPTISQVIPARFASTHHVKLLPRSDRDPSAYPSLKRFGTYQQRLAVSEFRWGAPALWAFMASNIGRAALSS